MFSKSGEKNHRLLRIDFLDCAGKLIAVHFRHGAIGNDNVKMSIAKLFQGFTTILGRNNRMRILFEVTAQHMTDVRLIVHDEHFEWRDGRYGSAGMLCSLAD